MGQAAQDRAGDGQAAGNGGPQGGGEGAGRDTSRFVIRPEWVPGSSFRLLPDGSVVRWVTNEGVLLDYAVRLRGAVDELKADPVVQGEVIDIDEPHERVRAVLERWGV